MSDPSTSMSDANPSQTTIPTENIIDDVPELGDEEAEVAALATEPEKVEKFKDYTGASMGACAWANKRKEKIDSKKLVLYHSKVGPYKGRVVGVGLPGKSSASAPIDVVRIDNDDTGKGIHFNAQYEDVTTRYKYAGVISPTVDLDKTKRKYLFEEHLKALENRSAEFIWHWWSTGSPV